MNIMSHISTAARPIRFDHSLVKGNIDGKSVDRIVNYKTVFEGNNVTHQMVSKTTNEVKLLADLKSLKARVEDVKFNTLVNTLNNKGSKPSDLFTVNYTTRREPTGQILVPTKVTTKTGPTETSKEICDLLNKKVPSETKTEYWDASYADYDCGYDNGKRAELSLTPVSVESSADETPRYNGYSPNYDHN